jgi:NAD(P)-dependent dehydrogenase (short-subunit alcohol dehydrogenase family)
MVKKSKTPFKGKVALVTGAAGAIGGATALFLANLGAKVIAVDINEFEIPHDKVTCVEADLSSIPHIYRLFTAIRDQERRLDFLANCIGLSIPETYDEVNGPTITRQFWANTGSAMYIANFAASQMLKNDGGHIVLFGSGVEDEPTIGNGVYAACKAGVRAYGLTMSRELSHDKVFVNIIWPSAESAMNPNSENSPEDIAMFIGALFTTNKWGHVFSVAGNVVEEVIMYRTRREVNL